VVHRSDACSTTAVFTDYLSQVSSDWKSMVGSGTTVTWPPNEVGASGNTGVAQEVTDTAGSIGYLDSGFAQEGDLTIVDLIGQGASGAVVNGGVAPIGDAVVNIFGSSGKSIKFLSNSSGGLEIADRHGNASAFSDRMSGFGGSGHSYQAQFIDLASVTSAGAITSSHVSGNAGNTSGTLFVSSGGALVAAVKMAGSYSASDFHITAAPFDTVPIADPPVANSGSVDPSPVDVFPKHGLDLPDLAFGAQMTLAYSENNAKTGGTLTVSDGRHAAAIALFGNYMAASLVAAGDGHGGTLVTEGQTTHPLLADPRA
jgi:PBP superfamily domain